MEGKYFGGEKMELKHKNLRYDYSKVVRVWRGGSIGSHQ